MHENGLKGSRSWGLPLAVLVFFGWRTLLLGKVFERFSSFRFPYPRASRPAPLFEPICRFPRVENDVFVAPNASVIGRVSIGPKSSVWYGAVVRGDLNDVAIGNCVAIKERVVITTARSVEGHVEAGVSIGNNVIIGESPPLHITSPDEGDEGTRTCFPWANDCV